MPISTENTDMLPNTSSKSSITTPTTPEEPLPSQLLATVPEENTDSESEDEDPGYDEPTCHWTPTKHLDEDCGEGVICPPCG